jgi:DsbC/DsbD-like thiol-disulfide interchange protein
MIATTLRHGAVSVALALGALSPAAAADDAWSSARLIAGSNPPQAAALRAGILITLAPGWNTYWRFPGDSGVPPRFDFSKSDNLDSVTVRWPAPQRIAEAGDTIIGYTKAVILSLVVRPKDTGQPVTLRLKLDYAVCEKLCVPVDATLALTLDDHAADDDAALAAAEARVPKPVPLGASAPFAIRAVRQKDDGRFQRVEVDVAAPAPVELFAEGPSPDWALPLPLPIDGAPEGLQRFFFELDGVPPGASTHGAILTLTAVGADQAIETQAPLQ